VNVPWTVETRPTPSRLLQWATPLLTIFFALLVGSLPLLLLGVDPLSAYRVFFEGAFGSFYRLSEVLVKATPLLFTGLAVALPLRAGLWNIGAEGQLHLGAAAATAVAVSWGQASPAQAPLLLGAMFLAGAAAGGVWGMIPGWLRVKHGLSEIVTTLMLNYIAIFSMEYLVFGPLKAPGMNRPQSALFPEAGWLPRWSGTRLHAGLIVALVVAALIYVLFARTRLGYEIRVLGANPKAAAANGVSPLKVTLWVMALGGLLAAWAGVSEVSGIQRRLRLGFSPGYGYTGIAVALLGKSHPVGVALSALFFAVLAVGGSFMQSQTFVSLFDPAHRVQVPNALVDILQALVIAFLIGGEFLIRHRVRLRRRSSAAIGAEGAQRG